MVQQQRFGGSIARTFGRLVSEHGLSSLTRGATTTVGRESMFTMSMLGVTPLIQTKLVAEAGVDENVALAAGALSGALIAGTATHPMDVRWDVNGRDNQHNRARNHSAFAVMTNPVRAVRPQTIKTCMQGDLAQVKYTGIVGTGRSLIAEYGMVQGLFKGLAYRIMLISTTFFLVNSFKQRLLPVMFPGKGRA